MAKSTFQSDMFIRKPFLLNFLLDVITIVTAFTALTVVVDRKEQIKILWRHIEQKLTLAE